MRSARPDLVAAGFGVARQEKEGLGWRMGMLWVGRMGLERRSHSPLWGSARQPGRVFGRRHAWGVLEHMRDMTCKLLCGRMEAMMMSAGWRNPQSIAYLLACHDALVKFVYLLHMHASDRVSACACAAENCIQIVYVHMHAPACSGVARSVRVRRSLTAHTPLQQVCWDMQAPLSTREGEG